MAFWQKLILEVLMIFSAHQFFVPYVAGVLGEEFLLFIAFISVAMSVSLFKVLGFGVLGILTFDSLLFLSARSKIAYKFKKKLGFLKHFTKIPRFVEKLNEKYTLITMAFSKFIFSVRIPLMIYLSHHQKMPYKKFLLYDIISVGFWGVIMVPLAVLAGKGFTRGLAFAENFGKIVGIAIIVIIALHLLNRLVIDEIILGSGKSAKLPASR